LLTIAATVPGDWDVRLISDVGTEAVGETVDRILSDCPDVVAFSCLTPAIDRAVKISQQLRHRNVSTIVGGLHATAAPQSCEGRFDAVAVGDGETLLTKMLCDWSTGKLGGVYRAEYPIEMSASPLPNWDLWGGAMPPRYTVQTMRGCPWACSFCAASRMLGPARVKPDRQIEWEIAAIAGRQSRPWIELADDNTFASDRDHAPMLEALRRAGARWFTESDWRIGLRPSLLRQIATSGCRQILIGFESNVFRYSGMGAKTADFDRVVEAAMAIQQAGIVVNACFIVGADGETRASMDRLAEFLETSPFGEIQLTIQTPFPGTALHESLRRSGRLLPVDFSRYTLFDVVYQPDRISVEELRTGFHDLVARVYRPDLQTRRGQIIKSVRSNARMIT
jgi:radical SAM superfamily enzyme YgiQ (UPF0313 family)